MPHFWVLVQRNHYASFTVEAKDEDQAVRCAEDKIASNDEDVSWKENDRSSFGYRFIRVVNEDKYADY
jgi:hypothetical protein